VTLTRRSLLAAAGGVALSPAIAKAAQLGSKSHIAVIGAGVFGAWTAHHLLAAGHKVSLIDANGPAHSRASSGGESRMTRAAYGKDAVYTRMARDSLPQWQALSQISGLPIFHPTGVLFFFPTEEEYVRDSIAAHKAFGLPTDVLTRAEMARRFPMIDFEGVQIGLYEPGFGVLMARRSVQTLVDRFVRSGGEFRHEAAHTPQQASGRLRSLGLASGGKVEADAFVFALGPWLPKLFPDVIGRRILPTRQEEFHFAAPARDRLTTGASPASLLTSGE
jgi:glycine/D-amino acid oxidase-like deaminating enzyme